MNDQREQRTRNVVVPDPENVSPERRKILIAKVALQTSTTAASVIDTYSAWIGAPDLSALADELDAWDGTLSDAEQMLHAQAHALNSIFTRLILTAHACTQLSQMEAHMRLALKAQNQGRMTLATLGELKNPRQVAFVKQANIANGPQQVNNCEARAHAENTGNAQNKLLESSNGEWLDTGAAGEAGRGDSTLEAVGALHGAENAGREISRRAERQQGRGPAFPQSNGEGVAAAARRA